MKKGNRKRILAKEKAMKQWIEEDQDGNLGLAILVLIYSLELALKRSSNPKPYYSDIRNESS